MTVVDSCGWLEYFKGTPLAEAFAPHIEGPDLGVPTMVIYEVYRVLRRDVSEEAANEVAAHLRTLQVVPLDEQLALDAADFGLQYRLATADAVIYATARALEATLATSDAHFAGLPGVQYLGASTG